MQGRALKSIGWSTGACTLLIALGAITTGGSKALAASVPLYLLITILVAWRAGFRASVPVALCATLGLDFFFTEPRFTFHVDARSDVLALFSFAAVSLLVSHQSHRIHAETDQVRQAELQQRALYDVSRNAMLVDWKQAVGTQLCTLVQQHFRLTAAALWEERNREFSMAGDWIAAEQTLHAAFRAEQSYDLDSRFERIRLLRSGVRPIGAVAFKGHLESYTADALAALLATNLERVQASRAEVAAESQARSEQLRTAVLDGLAHAVKTPLTTILVSSSGLREIGQLSALQDQLARVIETEAESLAVLTDKLLRTSRMEAQAVDLSPETVDVQAIVTAALDELSTIFDIGRVQVRVTPEASVCVEAELFRMTLVQLLENALKYSVAGTRVLLHAVTEETGLHVTIHNDGSFIPETERTLVFERFYRSPSMAHGAPGTGIGLSVAKRAVEAHGGKIWVESDLHAGTTFHITLPPDRQGACK